MEELLTIEKLRKYFSGHKAVDDISFNLKTGSIFGLLGPNGAGKTTLLRMITGIIHPDSGKILFRGNAFNALKDTNLIGYMPEERGLYKKMKVGDHLIYLARLKNLDRIEARKKAMYWVRRFELSNWWDKKVGDLSKGMQQKVQFISTILHEPKLLILDEPFSGLDPINSNIIKQEIYDLCQNGTTIIFSTHRMEQVEEICEHIVLINKGKKILDGKVDEIKNDFKKNEFSIVLDKAPQDNELNSPDYEIESIRENRLVVRLKDNVQNNEVLTSFMQKGYIIQSFNEILPSINEVFIEIVQNN